MTRFLTILVFTLLLAYSQANGQDCPAGHQCVPQASFNTMVNRLNELVEAREVINKMLTERGTADVALASAQRVIEGWKQLDAVNGMIIVKQKEMMELYEKTLNLYASLVEKLEARLMKPRSPWSKFLDAIKTVIMLAAGVALGRGL
jgi:hypothetical protein